MSKLWSPEQTEFCNRMIWKYVRSYTAEKNIQVSADRLEDYVQSVWLSLSEFKWKHPDREITAGLIERMVKTKYVEGEADAKVFDLLLASTAWDFADVYSNNLEGPRELVWRAAFRKQESSNDRCGQYETQINENIDKLIKWLEEHQY